MKLFEKTYKLSYTRMGYLDRKYIVYKFLFIKITRRIKSNLISGGENNRFFVKAKDNTVKEITNLDTFAKMYPNLKIMFEGSNNKITLAEDLNIRTSKIFMRGHDSELCIEHSKELIQRSSFELLSNSKLYIDEDFLSNGIKIYVGENSQISLGKRCMCCHNIRIRSTDGHPVYSTETKEHLNVPKDVRIGNRVWFADNAVVLKGVTIKDDCVVALNSTVTKPIYESNCIIAGNPGKIVKRNIYWEP